MADGRDGKTAFQQENGWSLSPKQRMRGRTTPGNLLGISEQRNQFTFNEDAPVSPGTKAPQNEVDGYFDSPAGSRIAANAYITSAPRDDASSISTLSGPSVASIAPWEQQTAGFVGGNSSSFPSNTPFGTYNDAWSETQRPGTSRTQTSESFASYAVDTGHKRSISDRLKQGASKHLRQDSNINRLNEKNGISSKKSSTASSGYRPRGMSVKDNGTPPRPKTPQASREVAPWDYQEAEQDIRFGTTTTVTSRQNPIMPELSRLDSQSSEASQATRRKMFGHHHRPSRDEGSRPLRPQHSTADLTSDRSRLATKQSRTNLNPFSRRQTESLRPSVTSHPDMPRLDTRATSPAGSIRSTLLGSQGEGPSSATSTKKSGLLGRIKGHLHKERDHSDDQNGSPYASSTGNTASPASMSRIFNDPSGFLTGSGQYDGPQSRHDSVATMAQPSAARKDSMLPAKKENAKSRIFHRDRAPTGRRSGAADSGQRGGERPDPQGGTLFELDKNLANMEGILAGQSQIIEYNNSIPQGTGGSYFDTQVAGPPSSLEAPTWDAPDSWAVKKDDGYPDKVSDIPEEYDETDAMIGTGSYCIRIFRVDGTFATLALPLGSSVNEILQLLGKKSFLQDDLDNYQIVMRKGELQRELAYTEKPILMQKRLLERVGYSSSDRIEQEGQDDNSYLCRFTFVGVKVSGYYSLDRDGLGFEFERMNKFSNIDLSGRSLVTIPIILYKKSSEIISLNLSKNLSLDVPRDFVQVCTHLKEIRFTGNEARSLPPSFSLASKLQVLDVSHNQIDQLENADLGRLSGLCSLKIANNRLSQLPFYFTQFKQLRSLDLSSNNFKELPNFFGELRSLSDLDISFNSLESWPPVEELESLERFWATNNLLHGPVPDEYRNLRNLKDVDIRFNTITNIDVISHLPNVEQVLVGHNSITKFEGSFPKLRLLQIDHNPITRFDITSPMPALTTLNLASNKLNELGSGVYEKVPNLAKLNLDKNHISNLAIDIGRLSRLEVLSIVKNPLITFPSTIGCLQELRRIDARECNIRRLPTEIWFCAKLEELNLASNVLDSFPRLTQATQPPMVDPVSARSNTSLQSTFSPSQTPDDNVNGDDRRPSQASGSAFSYGSSPASTTRKNSVMSNNTTTTLNGRKPSMPSRQPTELNVSSHKDSNSTAKIATTFSSSLRSLCLADNRLGEEVFDSLALLSDLRLLNLSYNEIGEIPAFVLRKWQNLSELYLSGNDLTSLPTEDLVHISSLKVLHLNSNKFQTLPAELSNIKRLLSLDVGCNVLKYNVANWPYDWNWVYNPNLRYLNFSGNRRLEIRPMQNNSSTFSSSNEVDLASFSSLQSLRILGLIDVTLTIDHVPDETDDRRVRTTGSALGGIRYGMADSLGKLEHLSILDLMVPRYRNHDNEFLIGMFDGQPMSSSGSRLARFLQENFKHYFAQQLSELKSGESAADALRRTFLTMNKDLITFTTSSWEQTQVRLKQTPIKLEGSAHALNPDDRTCGAVATVLFIQGMELFVANVGNAQAILIPSDGKFKFLTKEHKPADTDERQRIREAGGFVSRYGRLNDSLEVSRAFGFAQHVPAVMALPHVFQVTLRDIDEMVLVASKEFWDYVTPDLALDLARSERSDTMRASQRLRDLAIAFGASNKIMVMVVGVSQLRKSSRSTNRNTMVTSSMLDNVAPKRARRRADIDDTRLALLDREVDAPTGEIALVFTDIKSSTALWEQHQTAMRSAIRIHNELMRRQLRLIGGYEVKTEGDAFMIAFPTPTSALLWCFSVQNQLLAQEWPTEVLDSIHGQEIEDDDGITIYRGLSVRMGIHWGNPVYEPDPITRRMDYFGPVVNRAARIQGVADGGEITCSFDFIAEFERSLEMYADSSNDAVGRTSSSASDDTVLEDSFGQAIRRDLKAISEQGYEVKEMGETKLKGIENPEMLFQIYPHSLAGRQVMAETRRQAALSLKANQSQSGPTSQRDLQPGALQLNTKLNIEPQQVWSIWELSLRLEMLCSLLEDPSIGHLRSPETAIMERMRSQGGEVPDRVLVQFIEHLICRIETCVNTLEIRSMVRPLGNETLGVGGPMQDIIKKLTEDLKELEMYRQERRSQMTAG